MMSYKGTVCVVHYVLLYMNQFSGRLWQSDYDVFVLIAGTGGVLV